MSSLAADRDCSAQQLFALQRRSRGYVFARARLLSDGRYFVHPSSSARTTRSPTDSPIFCACPAVFFPWPGAGAKFAPVSVEDVAQAFRCALTDKTTIGQTYELCGPESMTLEQLVRITAAVAGIRCNILRLPDFVAWMQAAVMGLLPGKPSRSTTTGH